MPVAWTAHAERLRGLGLTATASMSGLRIWLPRTAVLVEVITIALFVSVVVFFLGLFLTGAPRALFSGVDRAAMTTAELNEHRALYFAIFNTIQSMQVVGVLGAMLSGVALLVAGSVHVLTAAIHPLRQRVGQEIQLSQRSLQARGRTIAYEEIVDIRLRKRFFLAFWLSVQTQDGRWVLVGHDDKESRLRHLGGLIEERVSAHRDALVRGGHDVSAAAVRPAALEALRER